MDGLYPFLLLITVSLRFRIIAVKQSSAARRESEIAPTVRDLRILRAEMDEIHIGKGNVQMKTVLFSERIHEEGMKMVQERYKIKVSPSTNEDVLCEEVKDADALIVRSSAITSKIIESGTRLKVIGRHGIGVDQIDIDAATRGKVAVVNTPDANSISVAEHAVASMLYLCKRLREVDTALREGVFAQKGSLPGLVTKLGYTTSELYSKNLGLIGFGRIARLVADICAKGFQMNVFAYDAYIPAEKIREYGAEPCTSVEEILKVGDVISIHVPLTKETKDLIGGKELALMKPGAFLINSARGGLVNEDALYRALKDKTIAGAAVDVYSQEPPDVNTPLFGIDNLLVTPHIAAMTDGALLRMATDVAREVISVLEGKRPRYLVNPEVWE